MEEKKPSRRVLMTKQLIKNSIIELLHEKSIQDITITEICNKADINRSTFYAYYSSPVDLMNHIKNDIIFDTIDILKNCPNLPPRKKTLLQLNRHLQYLSDNIHEFKAFSSEVGEDFSLPAKTMEIILLPYIDPLLETYVEPDKRDYYRAFCIFGTIGIVKNWIRGVITSEIKDLSVQILEMLDAMIMRQEL